ncbi:MAG TPA: bifunctional methylenetetrahydrofolate dehydrogenase/methenyltetrahydrofolate cyclohydrolase FolD [Ginsengibacter sp.]|nr:bifunctional methylenetetrahydrofolate dehydrogenase/methenyltetrahydrofolate cyclohydrolase FolD [Ginsengibacter sp.]HRP16535.1 bifunctional methylenetetrahydrofolate dehydrogenase/methenyltetrahydrofolate cyclohydrolase FolD [Ginsengibacter sp.]HRP44599.1 bifunctional methylenetetrahydrofolate dehydrogenase/methenyltetrahydrofolate cyclohydrolase FolD [Ginsengibacter sp.]
MELLDGKVASAAIKENLKSKTELLTASGKRAPHLAAILIGDDPASHTYVNSKVKNCHEVGIRSTLIQRDDSISEDELLQMIRGLNEDKEVDGILVQVPLPKHISENKVTLTIAPEKDVDGFHPVNIGNMVLGLPGFVSATPWGIILLLKHYGIKAEGKNVVIVGRSHTVGTPLSILFSRNTSFGNATVTLCHSRTHNLEEICRTADILVAAIGKAQFIKEDMVKEGAVVIDVGINRVKDSNTKSGFRLKGDVDFENVKGKCSYISPVPGGVGLMTIAALLTNTFDAYIRNNDVAL